MCETSASQEVTWLKNDVEITQDQHFTLVEEGLKHCLVIYDVTDFDSGQYSVKVADEHFPVTEIIVQGSDNI